MSLLFDALNRAQSKDAAPMPEASLPPPSDVMEKPGTAALALARPQSSVLTYVLGGLTLLMLIAAWYYYQMQSYTPVAPPQALIATASPAAAPQPVNIATSANAQFALASPGAGVSAAPEAHAPTRAARPRTKRRTPHTVISLMPKADPLKAGYRALSEGRLDQAEQHYLAVLDQRPHEKDALLGLAVIAQRKLQTQRATELYQQVLREDMGNAAAAAGLVSLSVQADPLAAESQLKELLDIKPTAPEFHYALGNVLARQQRWGEAQQSFFRALGLAPGNPLYAYNLAVSLEHLHQPAAALPFYAQAYRLSVSSDPTLDRDAIARRIKQLEIHTPEASP